MGCWSMLYNIVLDLDLLTILVIIDLHTLLTLTYFRWLYLIIHRGYTLSDTICMLRGYYQSNACIKSVLENIRFGGLNLNLLLKVMINTGESFQLSGCCLLYIHILWEVCKCLWIAKCIYESMYIYRVSL